MKRRQKALAISFLVFRVLVPKVMGMLGGGPDLPPHQSAEEGPEFGVWVFGVRTRHLALPGVAAGALQLRGDLRVECADVRVGRAGFTESVTCCYEGLGLLG